MGARPARPETGPLGFPHLVPVSHLHNLSRSCRRRFLAHPSPPPQTHPSASRLPLAGRSHGEIPLPPSSPARVLHPGCRHGFGLALTDSCLAAALACFWFQVKYSREPNNPTKCKICRARFSRRFVLCCFSDSIVFSVMHCSRQGHGPGPPCSLQGESSLPLSRF